MRPGVSAPIVRRLGLVDYLPTWQAMQAFTARRDAATPDEIWLLEHTPVFTLGLAGRDGQLLHDIGVPLLHVDRGGQITYHGPGQVVCYLLLDLTRRGLTVRGTVSLMEQVVIDTVASYGIAAHRRPGAPGVYVGTGLGDAKLAALGLRVRRGCCYHGLAMNVDIDLAPFAAIHPCGDPGMRATRLADLGVDIARESAAEALCGRLLASLAAETAARAPTP